MRHTALGEIGLRHYIGLTGDDNDWYKADVNIRIYTESIRVIQIRKNVCLVYSRPNVPALDPHARSDSGRDANTHAARYNIDHFLIRCQKLVTNTPVRYDIRQPERCDWIRLLLIGMLSETLIWLQSNCFRTTSSLSPSWRSGPYFKTQTRWSGRWEMVDAIDLEFVTGWRWEERWVRSAINSQHLQERPLNSDHVAYSLP